MVKKVAVILLNHPPIHTKDKEEQGNKEEDLTRKPVDATQLTKKDKNFNKTKGLEGLVFHHYSSKFKQSYMTLENRKKSLQLWGLALSSRYQSLYIL